MNGTDGMSSARKYNVISGDGHNEIPMERWRHWVPEKHWDTLPKLGRNDAGGEQWVIETHGERWVRSSSGNVVADWDYDEFLPTRPKYYREDGSRRPGTGDAIQRLQEQDLDGLDAEVLFPPIYSPHFFKNGLKKIDADAYRSFIRGYNDFMSEEYCAVAPDRLVGVALLPETGVDDAIAEMRHIKERGLRAVSLVNWPNGSEWYEPDDDRFFAAALDLDVKLAPHGSFGGRRPIPPGTASLTRDTIFSVAGGGGCTYAIGQLIGYGVFDRYPDLQIYFAETQAAWLPHTLDFTDDHYRRWNHYIDLDLPMMPSDYYLKHCKFGFVVDRLAMAFRDYIGIEMLMFGTDFPHSVGSFPHTRDWLEDLFEGVPEADRRKVLVDNVVDFFGLDVDADLTPTPSRGAGDLVGSGTPS
jgi:uncharacterized protein